GANRGASGIDGTIASAIGFQKGLQAPVTLVIGDLAFLHDLNSLSLLQSVNHPFVIVLVNNNGGGIFSFLPIGQFPQTFEKYFGTPHDLNLAKLVQGFGLSYFSPQSLTDFKKLYQKAITQKVCAVIEVKTDRTKNYQIQKELERFLLDAHS
ncbi:MAG: thiamine pyrophosphate-dependent enzyme, partial [Candidatus Omnitrophica bacterium]|nr:thiamine pyrophosphate-dependent enzyme [Candidatus Omnitrophota bacterium]